MGTHHLEIREDTQQSEKLKKQQDALIKQLFQYWQLTTQESDNLWSIIEKPFSKNDKVKCESLSFSQDTQECVGHLLAIHRYLKRAYPFNKELAYRWIKTPNLDFQQQTPLKIIEIEGVDGMLRVRNYLDSNQE